MAGKRHARWLAGGLLLVALLAWRAAGAHRARAPGPPSAAGGAGRPVPGVTVPRPGDSLKARRPSDKPVQRAIVVAPKRREADTWFDKGMTALSAGRTSEAITAFQRAARLEPDWARAHHNLGFAYDKAGRYEEAAGSYRLAMLLDPSEPETRNNLGGVYVKLDRYEEAVKEFQQAIALKPAHAEAHLNLGIAYLLLGDADRAQETAATLARLNRGLADELDGLIRQARGRSPGSP